MTVAKGVTKDTLYFNAWWCQNLAIAVAIAEAGSQHKSLCFCEIVYTCPFFPFLIISQSISSFAARVRQLCAALNFCASCVTCVSIECLVTWSTQVYKPKFVANLWNMLGVSTEFPALVRFCAYSKQSHEIGPRCGLDVLNITLCLFSGKYYRSFWLVKPGEFILTS